MKFRILPSLIVHKHNENILNPNILILEVYKDRISDKISPSFFLLIEKKETKSQQKDFGFDTLLISYKVFNSYRSIGEGVFEASCDNRRNKVSIISRSDYPNALILSPREIRGYKIGTYIMNQIIMWAKYNYPDAILTKIELSQNDAGLDNKERRNRFYEQFGIRFNYEDEKKENATSINNILIKQLNTVESWKQNIKEILISDYILNSINNMKICNENQKTISSLEEAINSFQKRNDDLFRDLANKKIIIASMCLAVVIAIVIIYFYTMS